MRVTGCIEKYAGGGYFWYVFDGDEVKYRNNNANSAINAIQDTLGINIERRPSPTETVAGGFGHALTRWGARIALRRAIKGHLKAAGIEIYKGEIKDGKVNVQRG